MDDVRLRLVVVVIGDKELYRIVRKELLELSVELSRECFVVAHDNGGLANLSNHVGDRKGLPGTCRTQQGLVMIAAFQPGDELADCLRLVAHGRKVG